MSKVKDCGRGMYSFYCPGCDHDHVYFTIQEETDSPIWNFNGDVNNPSFTPSLLNRWGKDVNPDWEEPTEAPPDKPGSWSGRCHLYVTNGVIDYCGDCSHLLNGHKGVPMREVA